LFGSIGIPELLIIFIVALVVIGPKRMPEIAKTLGKALRDFKRTTSDFQDSINIETDYDLEPTSTDKSTVKAQEEEKEPNRIDPAPRAEASKSTDSTESPNTGEKTDKPDGDPHGKGTKTT
jgi:Tat protein translocase TatB subunit